MKITTFNPQIITKDAEALVKLFEQLGFEKRHQQEGIGEFDVKGIRLKDANGFNLDISQPDTLPTGHDLMAIRMNVDDFDEAYQLLVKNGFKNYYGDSTASTRTGKSAIMISPTGFVINLVQHIK
ncbi:MAG: hypothetical protein IKN68_06030 [Spirochaetia bacterium]|nr:hypothetical protein [Spirochaetia bacterium]